jgi:hypothetical protein
MIMNNAYSSTPLLKKLGYKDGSRVRIINAPSNYFELLGELTDKIKIVKEANSKKDLIHFFASSMSQLEAELLILKSEIADHGIIWISWYKKSSGIVTDVTEDKIRKLALNSGLVDVKICSVDDKWSGLKLVIPLKNRNR